MLPTAPPPKKTKTEEEKTQDKITHFPLKHYEGKWGDTYSVPLVSAFLMWNRLYTEDQQMTLNSQTPSSKNLELFLFSKQCLGSAGVETLRHLVFWNGKMKREEIMKYRISWWLWAVGHSSIINSFINLLFTPTDILFVQLKSIWLLVYLF